MLQLCFLILLHSSLPAVALARASGRAVDVISAEQRGAILLINETRVTEVHWIFSNNHIATTWPDGRIDVKNHRFRRRLHGMEGGSLKMTEVTWEDRGTYTANVYIRGGDDDVHQKFHLKVYPVMLDPGEDPGGGSLERPKPRPQAEAMDGPGPRREEPLSAFRRRVNDMLLRIAKEEEKLGNMRLEYRRKKLQYDKVWNNKKQALQPGMNDLEQALERQNELLNSLKENSGAFKEKFENEKRFRRMRKDTRLQKDIENSELPEAAEMLVRGESVPEEETCSTVSPKTAETPAMEVSDLLPPQQPCVSSQQEVEEGAGMLELITEMESPLSGRSFRFSADSSDEDGEGDTVPRPAKERPVERMHFTRSALKDGKSTTSTGKSAGSSMRKSSVCPEKEKPQKTKKEYAVLSPRDIDIIVDVTSNGTCSLALTCLANASDVAVFWDHPNASESDQTLHLYPADPNATIKCTAKNPVSNVSKTITPWQHCQEDVHMSQRTDGSAQQWIVLAIVAVVILFCIMIFIGLKLSHCKKSRGQKLGTKKKAGVSIICDKVFLPETRPSQSHVSIYL